jgi:hypothetical protein
MTYLLLASIGAGVVVGWMRGGRLSRLGEARFIWWWAVPLVAAVQALLGSLTTSTSRLSVLHPRPLIMIGSYIALWAVVFRNRYQRGMALVLAGVTLNLIAIAANGGYMPISPEVLARIGAGQLACQIPLGSVVMGSKDVVLRPDEARFWMLGDNLVIPEPFPWPTAMSIGDALLAVGVFCYIVHSMRPQTQS